jgi:hypothetical protein
MKKGIIITLILIGLGVAGYFGYKAYQKSQDPTKG